MKNYLVLFASVLLGFVGFFAFQPEIVLGQLSILRPAQGGTGIGSATAGDVGKFLKLSDDSPMTYVLDTVSTGDTFPFTTTSHFGTTVNATNTPIWFQSGLQASSTSHFTIASSTNIRIGTGACLGAAGNALTVDSTGLIGCSTITASTAFPFTTTTNYGQTVNSTSTPIWFQNGLQASSTSHFVYASSTQLSTHFLSVGTSTPSNSSNSFSVSALGTNGAISIPASWTFFLLSISTGRVPYTTAGGQFTSDANLTYNGTTFNAFSNFAATSAKITVGNATTTNLTSSYFYNSGNAGFGTTTPAFTFSVNNSGSDFYITSTGKVVSRDTTRNISGALTPTRYLELQTGTTTSWTAGTTTDAYIAEVSAPFAGTLHDVSCMASSTNVFLGVRPYIGNTATAPDYFIASSTQGVINFTGSNTFTKGQRIGMLVGTSTTISTYVKLSCVFSATETF